jgi:hypothetical protein
LVLVMDEAALIVERENGRISTEAITLRAAAAAVMSKEGAQYFDSIIARLTGEQ